MTSLTTGLQLCITFLHFSFKNIRSVVGMFEWVSRFNNASKWFDIDIIIFLISIRIMCLYWFVHLPHLILLFSSSFFLIFFESLFSLFTGVYFCLPLTNKQLVQPRNDSLVESPKLYLKVEILFFLRYHFRNHERTPSQISVVTLLLILVDSPCSTCRDA